MKPENHHIWEDWAGLLHRWGLEEIIAWLLEATAPVNLVGAQLVYIGQPLLDSFVPGEHTDALAHMLEEPSETRAYIAFLREVKQP